MHLVLVDSVVAKEREEELVHILEKSSVSGAAST